MSVAETTTEFAPRRSRVPQLVQQQSEPQTVIEPIKPMTEDIAKDALRVSTLYGNTVKERNDFAQRLNEKTARLEQADVKISEQRSAIESLTAELNTERSERIRLAQVVEGIIHAAQRAIEQPGQRENEQD